MNPSLCVAVAGAGTLGVGTWLYRKEPQQAAQNLADDLARSIPNTGTPDPGGRGKSGDPGKKNDPDDPEKNDPCADDSAAYEEYWNSVLQATSPEQSAPYNILNRYNSAGELHSVTTYDEFGNRAYQYELNDNVRHGPGYHQFDNSGPCRGFGKGPRSPHIPFQ